MSHRPPARRRGFTLAEALLAISLTAIVGTAMMAALAGTADVNATALDRFVAQGIAETMMDEVAGFSYCELGTSAYQSPLGAGSGEWVGTNRVNCDDMDDFHGLDQKPPLDPWGVELGKDNAGSTMRHANFRLPTSYLSRFRCKVEGYYVSSADLTTKLTGTSTSDYRAFHVRVLVTDPGSSEREIVNLRRVFANVPAL